MRLNNHQYPRISIFFEFIRIVLGFIGSWPFFGLVFLLYFHIPIQDALQVLLEKVRRAKEITYQGVSLITTLDAEANRAGFGALAETLPELSPDAIDYLMHASRGTQYVIFSNISDGKGGIIGFSFADEHRWDVVRELNEKGLVDVITYREGGREAEFGVDKAMRRLEECKKKYPGTLSKGASLDDDMLNWKFNNPIPGHKYCLSIVWKPTELGLKAIDIIVRTVAAAITRKSDTTDKTNEGGH